MNPRVFIYVENAPYLVVEQVLVPAGPRLLLCRAVQFDSPMHQCHRHSTWADFEINRDSLFVTEFLKMARFSSCPFADDQDAREWVPERPAASEAVIL